MWVARDGRQAGSVPRGLTRRRFQRRPRMGRKVRLQAPACIASFRLALRRGNTHHHHLLPTLRRWRT